MAAGPRREQGWGTGAGYSLHEFTRGPLRAESHEVIYTDDSPCVPVPAEGTYGAKPLVTQTIPSSGGLLSAPLPTPRPGVQRARAGLHMLALPLIRQDSGQGMWPLKHSFPHQVQLRTRPPQQL